MLRLTMRCPSRRHALHGSINSTVALAAISAPACRKVTRRSFSLDAARSELISFYCGRRKVACRGGLWGIGMRLTRGALPGGRRSRARPEAESASAGSAAGPKLARPAGRGPPRGVDLAGLQKVVSRIQDVVAEPGAWNGVLDEISAAAGAQGTSLFRASLTTPDVALLSVSASSQQIMERYLREGWLHRDIRTRAIPKDAEDRRRRGPGLHDSGRDRARAVLSRSLGAMRATLVGRRRVPFGR